MLAPLLAIAPASVAWSPKVGLVMIVANVIAIGIGKATIKHPNEGAQLPNPTMFGGMSLYGYTTGRDLSAFGSFLVMGVWGLIIAGLVNLFLQSTGLQFALSILSVLIFAGLTAWDTQMIREMYFESDGYEIAQKKSVFGALTLYLDFINMFQSLLFLFGDRND